MTDNGAPSMTSFPPIFPTRRVIAPGIDHLIGQVFQVHEHGFVKLIDYMGNDDSIVQAARVSYGQGTKSVREDVGLISYLMSHNHTSPFEMCELKLHIKLPIFVARQWIRHRTANVNEISARYSILETEFFIPTAETLREQSTTNRQGSANLLTSAVAQEVHELLLHDAATAEQTYNHVLSAGLTRELARIGLPLSTYTQWYWKIDLHNLLGFLGQRAESHAQQEIQDYAHVVKDLVAAWVPMAYRAWLEYKFHAVTLSVAQQQAVRRLILGDPIEEVRSTLPRRDWEKVQRLLDVGQGD